MKKIIISGITGMALGFLAHSIQYDTFIFKDYIKTTSENKIIKEKFYSDGMAQDLEKYYQEYHKPYTQNKVAIKFHIDNLYENFDETKLNDKLRAFLIKIRMDK